MEKFALLVPCFNASSYIDDFIINIQSLTKQFDEVIFYDDASTDNTIQLLIQYNQKVLQGKSNKGPGYARNRLVDACKSDWFHFHDIDDFLHKDYLKKVTKNNNIKNADVILCNVDWLDFNKEHLEIAWKYDNQKINHNAILYTIENPIGGINGLYKRDIFMKISGFNEKLIMWEDSDLHVRLAIANAKFIVVEEVLSYSIRHRQSLSSNQNKAWKYRLICLRTYLNNSDLSKEIKISIGKLSEKLASTFIYNKQYLFAKAAILLTVQSGLTYPNSNNIIWKILKFIFPKHFVILLRFTYLKITFNKK